MAHRWHTARRDTPASKARTRDYNSREHKQGRAKAKQHHHPSQPCARCHHPLGPMGPWLHYDHNDTRTGYLGFSHGQRPCPTCGKRCNLSVAGKAGNRAQQATRTTPTPRPRRAQSRNWTTDTA